jgi:hypothetical protein
MQVSLPSGTEMFGHEMLMSTRGRISGVTFGVTAIIELAKLP